MKQANIESFPSISMMTFLKDYVGEDASINDATAKKLSKATHTCIIFLLLSGFNHVRLSVTTWTLLSMRFSQARILE